MKNFLAYAIEALLIIVGVVCVTRYLLFGVGYLPQDSLVPLDTWALVSLTQYALYRSFVKVSAAFKRFVPALAAFLLALSTFLEIGTSLFSSINKNFKKDE